MNNHFNKRGRNNHQRRRQGVNPNRALDSNGPDVRIRGTAQQIYDKYLALARDATSSGDRVKAENYLQHAEHYFRVLRSIQGPQVQSAENSAGDNDFDSEQPAIGGDRDQRDNRQPASQFESEDREAESVDDRSVESEANGAADSQPPEQQAQDPRPQNADQEGRRRRRRPRRPREEGGTEETAADETEPAAV